MFSEYPKGKFVEYQIWKPNFSPKKIKIKNGKALGKPESKWEREREP